MAAERAAGHRLRAVPARLSNAVIRRVAATGLTVDFRESYPVLTEDDLCTLPDDRPGVDRGPDRLGDRALAGGVAALTRYVAGGGCSSWACPRTRRPSRSSGRTTRSSMPSARGSAIRPAVADDESGRYPSVMFPQCYFRATETFAAEGVDRNLVLDRSTILEARPPALILAKTSPTAFARVGLGRDLRKDIAHPPGRIPLVAMAKCGEGYVLAIPRFTLNIGGFNGRVGTQPLASLDWMPSSDRFVQNILSPDGQALGGRIHLVGAVGEPGRPRPGPGLARRPPEGGSRSRPSRRGAPSSGHTRTPGPIAGPTARRSGATCTGTISTTASGPPGATSTATTRG